MAPRPPNYHQQRGDRARIKQQKKQERLQRREEDAQKRREEREGLDSADPSAPEPGTPDPGSPGGTPLEND